MSIPQNRERSPLWLRLLRGTLSLVAWAIVIVLAVAVWFRLFRYDATYELVWLNSFTRYVYLPAYASLVWARWMRRWVLLATAGAIVACHLTWVLPDFAPAAPTAARSETNPTLRIFLANVSIMNDHFDAMFSEIAAAQPQVVVLIEYNNAWHAAAESSPVLAAFPHRAKTPGFGGNTVAVFSQVPIVDQFQDRFQMER